jgi:hypothetical protein
VLCDFGAAYFGEKLHDDDVQPDQYRCPEVILGVPWSNKLDVWSVGCMVVMSNTPLGSVADSIVLDLGYLRRAPAISWHGSRAWRLPREGSPCRDDCASGPAKPGLRQSGKPKVEVLLRVW